MPQIRVVVRLYGPFRRHAAVPRLTLQAGSTLADLYSQLGIPAEEVKQAFVNGRRREPDHVLQDGDEVGVFPPVAGGC